MKVNGTNTIRMLSKGYPMSVVDVTDLQPVEAEINSTPALIRGVAARFTQLGCEVKGFDAYCESTVQAFVPFDILDEFVAGIDAVLGEGACHVLSIRPQGGVEAFVEE